MSDVFLYAIRKPQICPITALGNEGKTPPLYLEVVLVLFIREESCEENFIILI